MIKVLVGDQNVFTRRGLREILNEQTGMIVVAEAQDAFEFLDEVRKQQWDVLLLDVALPGKPNLDLIKQVRLEYPKLPIMVLSTIADEHYASRTLRAGASGYITKDSMPRELARAIRKVVQGKRFLSAELAEKVAIASMTGIDRPPHEQLSDREYQVMFLIAVGRTTRDIAHELSLSEKTIGTYRANIMAKLGLPNNAAVARYAMQNKLVI